MCEDAPCCGCCPAVQEQGDYREQYEAEIAAEECAAWDRGDDLADYNDSEADDYQDE
jgi:hypothetical protein